MFGCFIAASLALVVGIGLIIWSTLRERKPAAFQDAVPIQTEEFVAKPREAVETGQQSQGTPTAAEKIDESPALTMPSAGEGEESAGESGEGRVPAKAGVVKVGVVGDEDDPSNDRDLPSQTEKTDESQSEEAVAVNTESEQDRPKAAPKAKRTRRMKNPNIGANTDVGQKRQTQKKVKKAAPDTETSQLPKAKPLDDNPF